MVGRESKEQSLRSPRINHITVLAFLFDQCSRGLSWSTLRVLLLLLLLMRHHCPAFSQPKILRLDAEKTQLMQQLKARTAEMLAEAEEDLADKYCFVSLNEVLQRNRTKALKVNRVSFLLGSFLPCISAWYDLCDREALSVKGEIFQATKKLG